jgi:branched-chain amino acid aminotransferase
MHRYLLHNDTILDAHAKDACFGQTGIMNGWGVFSTLRVSRGVLFAYERHWARMQHDAKRLRIPFPADPDYLATRLRKLIEANSALDATLRVAVVRNHGGPFEGPGISRDFDIVAFTTTLADWGESVRLAVKPQARHAQNEFAGAKVMSWAFNLAWYEEAHERGFDEMLLLNERSEVSECTSANIFSAQENRVLTPPLTSGCLPGITRELLLEAVCVPGISVHEQVLLPSDLEEADEVFISSSTRDLLPVRFIEGLRVKHGAVVIEKLRKALIDYRERYIEEHTAKASASRAETLPV